MGLADGIAWEKEYGIAQNIQDNGIKGLAQQKIANYFIHASVACDNIILTKKEAIKEIENIFEDSDIYSINENNVWTKSESDISDRDWINKNIMRIR